MNYSRRNEDSRQPQCSHPRRLPSLDDDVFEGRGVKEDVGPSS